MLGGLRPSSDLDLLVVTSERTSPEERQLLVERLTPISYRPQRPPSWRPLEVTIVVSSDVTPWRFPSRTDFQHGEWLRGRYAEGKFDPEHPENPDLAILLAMVRSHGHALVGPPPAEVLHEVPHPDLVRALTGVIPDLLVHLDTDTANVLLTLARIWHTLETGEFAPKDTAADWALARLASHAAASLERARDVYLGTAEDTWEGLQAEASTTTHLMADRIERAASRT